VYDGSVRGLVVLVLMAACYDPSPLAGSPCSANGTCPDTLVCTSGICLLPGVGADAPSGDDAPDSSIDATSMIDAPPTMGWSTPVALSINTSSKESDAAFTPDRLELYFISTRLGGTGGDDIWYTRRQTLSDPWETPTNVTPLNSPQSENSVQISADGNRLYFQSTRTTSGDIYMATKVGLAWGAPAPVTELNSNSGEAGIALSPDELTAIVDRGSLGSRTLHIATRSTPTDTFGPLSAMTVINMTDDPSSPSLTNGANVVYFHADTPRNIYRSTKVGLSWSTPVPVTEVNTAMRDAAPATDEADDYMIFERENQLYETSR
jgi:hypothetical protein